MRGAREREGRAPQARWLQLASVAADGTPRVRTRSEFVAPIHPDTRTATQTPPLPLLLG